MKTDLNNVRIQPLDFPDHREKSRIQFIEHIKREYAAFKIREKESIEQYQQADY
jgi:hypothetical protein